MQWAQRRSLYPITVTLCTRRVSIAANYVNHAFLSMPLAARRHHAALGVESRSLRVGVMQEHVHDGRLPCHLGHAAYRTVASSCPRG